jgi:DNA-binding LytR/AlgR family response regulator
MRVLIVEKDEITANYLSNIVHCADHEVVGVAKLISEANILLKQNVDVVFLAINLEGKDSGIDLATILNKSQIPFIYITSNIDAGIIAEAVSTNPSGYFTKPVNQRDIIVALALIASRVTLAITDIIFKTVQGENKIPLKDVLYITSDNVHIQLHTHLEKYTQRCTLKSFELLNQAENLVRIHRSYIVNVNKISKIENGFAIINKMKIPIARAHKKSMETYFLTRT